MKIRGINFEFLCGQGGEVKQYITHLGSYLHVLVIIAIVCTFISPSLG